MQHWNNGTFNGNIWEQWHLLLRIMSRTSHTITVFDPLILLIYLSIYIWQNKFFHSPQMCMVLNPDVLLISMMWYPQFLVLKRRMRTAANIMSPLPWYPPINNSMLKCPLHLEIFPLSEFWSFMTSISKKNNLLHPIFAWTHRNFFLLKFNMLPST